MTHDEPQQLPLFADWTASSPTAAPKSSCSSEHETHSCAGSTSISTAATATTPTAHARAGSMPGGASAATRPSPAASSTAASEGQATLSICTEPRHTPDPVLAILDQRPTTRAECLQEARPCPWVSCRHHLLLEVSLTETGRDLRPTSLRINRQVLGRGRKTGRRSGLASSADRGTADRWTDDAVEWLAGMVYTCALDVADQYPDGVPARGVGLALGVSETEARAELEVARDRLRTELAELDQEDT